MHTGYAQKNILALIALLQAITGSTTWAMDLNRKSYTTPQNQQYKVKLHHTYEKKALTPGDIAEVFGVGIISGGAHTIGQLIVQKTFEQINNQIINRSEYQALLKGQFRDKVMDTLKAQRQIFQTYSMLMKECGHLLSEEERKIIDENYLYFLARLDNLIPTEATINHQQQIYCAMQPKIEQILNYTAMLQENHAPEIQQQIKKELVATSSYFKPLVEVPQRTNFDILKEAASSPAGTFVGGVAATVGLYACYAAAQK